MTLTNHARQIITEELIKRAMALGACEEGIDQADGNIGKPISWLGLAYSDWAARLFDGCSILSDGSKFWYRNGKLHRDDGPAIEYASGSKAWFRNGNCHREDGPATEYASGHMEWYRNGVRYYPEQEAIQ